MKLPTEQQCQDYFTQYVVPLNIASHCRKVREVADFLAKKAQQSGISVNRRLVNCLALLHDLFKIVSLQEDDLQPNKFHSYVFSDAEKAMWTELREKYPHMYEGEVAYAVFKDEFPQLALALKNVGNPHHDDPSWEEMIVKYADWRVFQNKVISLQGRLAYLQERYPSPRWPEYIKKMLALERDLMTHLKLDPQDIEQKMDAPKMELKN